MTVNPTEELGITFLRSTTKTLVDRERDGETTVRVEHTARFAVRDGALPDQEADYNRTTTFEPNWLEIDWVDGVLREVRVSGPQRLKAGGTSTKVTKHRTWGSWFRRPVADLPTELADAVRGYETAVATLTGGRR